MCLHICFPLWFIISSAHNNRILAEPLVVHSVVIFRLSLLLLAGWVHGNERTDCCLSAAVVSIQPSKAGCDGFLCHGNFIWP